MELHRVGSDWVTEHTCTQGWNPSPLYWKSERESCSIGSNSATPMDCTVHVILQARILPNPRTKSRSPALQVDSLSAELPGKPKNTGVSSLSLPQGIFQIQELNWDLLCCWWILYQLSYQGRTALEGWFLTSGPPGKFPIFLTDGWFLIILDTRLLSDIWLKIYSPILQFVLFFFLQFLDDVSWSMKV